MGRGLLAALMCMVAIFLAGCGSVSESSRSGTSSDGPGGSSEGPPEGLCTSRSDVDLPGGQQRSRAALLVCENVAGQGTDKAEVSECKGARVGINYGRGGTEGIASGSARLTVTDATGNTIVDVTLRPDQQEEFHMMHESERYVLEATRSPDFQGSFTFSATCTWY